MDNAIYVGLSRQMLLQRELDIVANNLANVDTTGFKFESMLANDRPGDDADAGPGADAGRLRGRRRRGARLHARTR